MDLASESRLIRERLICALWLLCVLCTGAALGQGIDLNTRQDAAVEDYDFSWVYWFETRGQVYVHEALGERALPWDTPASRRWRTQANQALQQMLLVQEADDRVRAAAVLSLARLGDETLLERLLPKRGAPGDLDGDGIDDATPTTSLLQDRSAEVRRSAWAALGLLDTEQTRAALAREPGEKAKAADRAAQAVAIGLLEKPGRAHLVWLADRLKDGKESVEVKRWCLWTLRQHDGKETDAVVKAALASLPSPFVISEVLQGRGWVGRNGGAGLLVDVLRYHPEVRGWQGYRALSGLGEGGVAGSTPKRLAMETRIAAALSLAEWPGLEAGVERSRMLGLLRLRMTAGNTAQAMDFNRGFDTLAYFMHSHASAADRELLYEQLRGFTRLRRDDRGVTEGLAEGAEPKAGDLLKRQSDNAVRSYAALAAGLLIRRATEGTALNAERPIVGRASIEIDRLKRRFGLRLMRGVADRREPMGYRAACALALGLTGDERYAGELVTELGKLRGGDEAVLGYGLLALAMLGEDRAAVPARRYVTRSGAVRGMDDQLGRRAALRALGVIGLRGGEDVRAGIGGAWERDPWVALSVAEASAWAGRYEAVDKMIEATKHESAQWRRAAALSLGVVFEDAYPSRLSRLGRSVNPVMTFGLSEQGGAGTSPDASGVEGAGSGPASTARRVALPMAGLYALDDPFVFEKLLAEQRAVPKPSGDADDDDAN